MAVINSVNPMYYVGFSTATLVASLILFQGLNTEDAVATISLLCGFAITFLGVHLLEISRKPDPGAGAHPHAHHSALESGLMHPRLSIHGRMSIDGWNGAAGTPIGGTMPFSPSPSHGGHGRRSSLYRNQSQTLFQAFEEDEEDADGLGLGLDTLHEAEDDELEADERTALRSGRSNGFFHPNGHANGHGRGGRGSRSASGTPRESRSPR